MSDAHLTACAEKIWIVQAKLKNCSGRPWCRARECRHLRFQLNWLKNCFEELLEAKEK